MKTKKNSRENPYLKRAFLYLPISIMSITYGILHALKIHAVPIKLIMCIKYPLLAVPLLLDAILFLTFYTQTFRGSEKLPIPPIKMGTQNSIGYVCSVQMLVLIAISSCYSLAYALVVACFSVITVISCILMNKKANKWANKENPLKQQKVRLELIWPSLYIVALNIVCGYFLVISESSSINLVAGIPIVLPMGIATLYSITMFWVEDYKRKEKEALHPAHLVFLILLFVFTLFGNVVKIPLNNGNNEEPLLPFQHMGLVAWAVVISSVFAQFEAWAVVERRRNDRIEIRRYIRSANIVTVALLVFIPIIYIFSSGVNISPFYMIGFCIIGCTYLVIRIFYFNHQTEDDYEYIPNEKVIRRIKIFLTAVCTFLLVVFEVLPNDKVDQLKNFLSENIPTVLYILSGFPMVGIILQHVIKKESPINILNLMFNLSYYETTKNLCKQVLCWSSSGALVCFIATLVIRESIGQTGAPFPYKLSVVCMHYISVTFLCLLIIAIELIKKINSGNKTSEKTDSTERHLDSNERATSQDIKDVKTRITKIFELLHVPSVTMIFLLIFVPSIINTSNFFMSLVKPIPLTFIAMAGFALNNYIDAEKDLINKPNRAIPSGVISKHFAISSCVLLYLISAIILLVFSQSTFETGICIIAGIGTILYSLCAKHIGYVKTLITGLLTITPFLIVFYYYKPKVNESLFLLAIILSTIGKELLMDVRDISGDTTVGQFTVATLLGERVTQNLSIFMSSLAVVFYLLSYQFIISISLGITSIAVGILIISYKIWFSCSDNKTEYGIYLLWGVIIVCSLPILV